MRELTLAPEIADVATTVAPSGASAPSTRRSFMTRSSPARHVSPSRRTSRGTASRSRTWTCRAPNCASASATRAGLGPTREVAADGSPSEAPARRRKRRRARASLPGSMPASWLRSRSPCAIAFEMRGNSALTFVPQGGDTKWTVRSAWPHPCFGGDFLPQQRRVDAKGFEAQYRIGNLALGKSLVATGDVAAQSDIASRQSSRNSTQVRQHRSSSSRSTFIRRSTARPSTASCSSASRSSRC